MLADFPREESTTLVQAQANLLPRSGVDDDAMNGAAEALREIEIMATLPDLHSLNQSQLERMSIDELRAVAGALNVPHRAQITEQDELIEAIRRYL